MNLNLRMPLKLSSLLLLLLSIAANPVKNDLVELSGFLNAREEAKFRGTDQNKVYSLHPGTKAIVQEVKHFNETGNYGLCLQVLNAAVNSEKNCYWVYYVPSRPTLKLLQIDATSEKRDTLLKQWNEPKNRVGIDTFNKKLNPVAVTLSPERATGAIVTVKTKAIFVPEKLNLLPARNALNEITVAVAKQANAINEKMNRTIAPIVSSVANAASTEKDCKYCVPKISKYEECTSKNDYFEKEIDGLSQKDPQNLIFSLLKGDGKPRYIKDICFAGSLLSFGGPYKYCAPGETTAPEKSVGRACVSDRYNKLIRNSFEAAADCLGDYLSGNKETARDSMIDIFGLMTVESGLHINARSKVMYDSQGNVLAGGAGGPGQLTQGAIQAINNQELKLMKAHLADSKNSTCRLLETTLDKPMKDRMSQSCDRISISSGNPLKNMMYTIAYQKQTRFTIRKYHLENPLSAHVFGHLSNGDKDYLERQLGIWAHNSGDGALNKALRSYLRAYRGKNLTSRDDIKVFLKGMRPHMQAANSGRTNPDEPVNFWNRIQKRMDDLNNNVGDGSCVVGQK